MVGTLTATGLQLLPCYGKTTVKLVKRNRQHWYQINDDDELLPSVTTILKIMDKSGPLAVWAKNTALENVRTALMAYAASPFAQEDYGLWVNDVIEMARTAPDKARDKSAIQGTKTHELIADTLHGGAPQIPDLLFPAVHGALGFVKDHSLRMEATETKIWHPEFKYAGTVDFIGRDPKGRLIVADWKRSKGIYPEFGYQIAAYAKAIEALTGETVAGVYAVRLPRDEGSYESRQIVNISRAFRTYLAAQSLWWKAKETIWAE